MAATHELEVTSWDISGAFLKGFSFERVRQILRQRGVSSPSRRVVIVPTWDTFQPGLQHQSCRPGLLWAGVSEACIWLS